MCEHLRKTHQVSLLSFYRQYPKWLFPGSSDRDPSTHPLTTPNRPTLDPMNPISWRKTAHQVLDAKPEMLIMHWWVTFWALPFFFIARTTRKNKIPVLYLCHNILPHEAYPWDRLLAKLALGQGNYFVTMSQTEKETLHRLVGSDNIHYTSHPSYSSLASSGPLWSQKQARARLGIPEKQRVILFFGLVRAYKGLHYLLDALAMLDRQTNARLWIVGEFWKDKQVYLEQIDRLGIAPRVTIVDQYIANEDIALYMNAADVIALPYVSVTQSGVVQLAFGLGKPVITTSAGSMPDVVTHGKTGLIVPPGDAAALAEALRQFFAQDLGAAMRNAILVERENSSWTHLVTLIEQIGGARQSNHIK